jgi:hypothetical protein
MDKSDIGGGWMRRRFCTFGGGTDETWKGGTRERMNEREASESGPKGMGGRAGGTG